MTDEQPTAPAASIPSDVTQLIDALHQGAREALGADMVGFYLRGSLAQGGFDPQTSDVDALVVTERPVTDAQFAALEELHNRLPADENCYGRHYEVAYVDRASIRRFRPDERVHPTVGSDWPFHRATLRDNFTVERWTVREHGVAIAGPDPKTLIDPVPVEELRSAALSELKLRADSWAGGHALLEWLLPRYYQAFEIETICRILYTLELGRPPTKPQAVAWALESIEEPWRSLVVWSQAHRADKTADAHRIPDVAEFVRWAAERSGPSRTSSPREGA